MTWISAIAVILCAGVVTSAARVRGGRFGSKAAFAVAAAALATAGYVVYRYGPGAGLPRAIAVAVPALSCLACYWSVHHHFAASQFGAGFFASLLGFAMFCFAFVVQFGERGLVDSWRDLPAGALSAENDLDAQRSRLETREQELADRLANGIPEFRARLQRQVDDVTVELASATSADVVTLNDELTEIVRLELALDREEHAIARLLTRLRQEQRRLGRLQGASENLKDRQALFDELDELWVESGTRLARPLDERLGAGVLEDALVSQRVAERLGS